MPSMSFTYHSLSDDAQRSEEGLDRYTHRINLPEVGRDGQVRLRNASRLIVGAGGLGSAAALSLAAAGIGHFGIVDHDRVELSDLQRQIQHSTGDAGKGKAVSAAWRLAGLNPHIHVTPPATVTFSSD